MSEFDYANEWKWWGFGGLAGIGGLPGTGVQFIRFWERRHSVADASPLSADGQRAFPYWISPHSPFNDFVVFFSYLILDHVDLSYFLFNRHRRVSDFLILIRRLVRQHPMMQMSRPFDTDGFNTDIRWTCVGRGRKKSKSYRRQKEFVRYGGISEMRKEEEKIDAFSENQDRVLMHDRCHLDDFHCRHCHHPIFMNTGS